MLKDKSVSDLVDEEIRVLLVDVIEEDDPIDASDTLQNIGLNSLQLARLIITLENEIGVDPFAGDHAIADMRTVGALVHACETTLAARRSSPFGVSERIPAEFL